jgi:hypothetical protein
MPLKRKSLFWVTLSVVCFLACAAIRVGTWSQDFTDVRPSVSFRSEPVKPVRLSFEPSFPSAILPAAYDNAVRELLAFGPDVRDVPSDLHLIRLWSVPRSDPDAVDQVSKAHRAVDALLSRSGFVSRYGTSHPFLYRTRNGAQFAEKDFFSGKTDYAFIGSHLGLTLSVLGELGVPVSRSCETQDSTASVADCLNDLIANFTAEMEIDWATVALAFYLPPERQWRNKFGDTFSFDREVDDLCSRPFGHGSSCAGTHTLCTLSVLLAVDRKVTILAEPQRSKAHAVLRRAKELLGKNQLSSGAWDIDWFADGSQHPVVPARQWSVERENLVTGHHLEWLALLPRNERIEERYLRRAIDFVVGQFLNGKRDRFIRNVCAFSHAPRAIRLLVGSDQNDVRSRTQRAW